MTDVTTPDGARPLWTYDHPYYATEGNYHAHGYHYTYTSWAEFVDAEGDNDLDLNLVYRWDFDPSEYLDDTGPAARTAYADRFGERDHAFTLKIFWMLQRKANCRSTFVSVCRADEPAVRAWLTERAEHARRVWAPLLPGGA